MAVFICWSGDRSHKVAQAMSNLLTRDPLKLDKNEMFISDSIEKGIAWFDSIVQGLAKSRVGIVCLTAENVTNPWLHFESGALLGLANKAFNSEGEADPIGSTEMTRPRQRLFTLFHGITGVDLKGGPLGAFQATRTTRTDLGEMILTVATALGKGPVPACNNKNPIIGDDAWEEFEASVHGATVPARRLIPGFESLFTHRAFNEPLKESALQDCFRWYDGARLTRERLAAHRDLVLAACPVHEREIFEVLLAELEAYAMAIEAFVLSQQSPSNRREIGEVKAQACCEKRRLAIRSLSELLLEPTEKPLQTQAVRFMAAETDEERITIVLGLEGNIRRERDAVYEGGDAPDIFHQKIGRLTGGLEASRFRESPWDLDRIYYYMLVRYFIFATLRWKPVSGQVVIANEATVPHSAIGPGPLRHDWPCASRDVTMEVERYHVGYKGASLLPLKYALVALQRINRGTPPEPELAQTTVATALDFVEREIGSQERQSSRVGTEIDGVVEAFKKRRGGSRLEPETKRH